VDAICGIEKALTQIKRASRSYADTWAVRVMDLLMETSTESSYLCAIECKNCSLYYSVRLEDLVDPLACPYCSNVPFYVQKRLLIKA